MSNPHTNSPSQEVTDADRLRGLLTPDALSLDVVSALAGDRPMVDVEKVFLAEQRGRRGELFFSDILYVITHQHFSPKVAEKLWNEILGHKLEMSTDLNRNVRIVVAALDYLSNLKNELVATTLIGEAHVATIANLSMRDGLTGLFNHTSCFELLDVELRLFERHKSTVALLMIDIDDFKEINDLHGHQEGDRVLAALAAILVHETRKGDICCRYGGEEFAVIMPFTEATEAGEIADRLRLAVTRGRPHGQDITISVGVACCDERTLSPLALVRHADEALYRAKSTGKNRVVVSGA